MLLNGSGSNVDQTACMAGHHTCGSCRYRVLDGVMMMPYQRVLMQECGARRSVTR